MKSPTRPDRGFTLLELLVVVSILVLAMMVFAVSFGNMGGPPMGRAANGISMLSARVRQLAATRKIHSEVVLDYRANRVIALSREPLANFAFEDVGSTQTRGSGQGGIDLWGRLSGAAGVIGGRQHRLLDGKALELTDDQAAFTIPWQGNFAVDGDIEGAALSFDFYPFEVNAGGGTTLVGMGSVFQLRVGEIVGKALRLQLDCGAASVEASTLVAMDRWCTVELAVSRYGVRLYVDGRLSEAVIKDPDSFRVPPAAGSEVVFLGYPGRIDNVALYSLVSSQSIDLDQVHLLPYGQDPEAELRGELEEIYDPKKTDGPITGAGAGPGACGDPANSDPFNDRPPPGIRHIYFDAAGRLDSAIHDGAAYVFMVSRGSGDRTSRMILTFHKLGFVSSDYVDYFPWEAAPKQDTPEDD